MAQPHPDPKLPPFKLGGTIYNQGTFKGRLYHFCGLIDPRSLFVSESRLQDAVALLDSYEQGTLAPTVTNEDLWAAQKIKQSIIHPDTGERIMMPFRMSGFVPFNTPIVIGLLLPNQTVGTTIFWQWLNQSHNACFNYSNRNATKPTPTSSLVMGYTGAVGSAVSIAVGLHVGLSKLKKFTPEVKALLGRFVPYPAVATANVCNVALMRYSSLSSGIDVYDKTGKVIGASQVAAKQAVISTAITRVVLAAPILLIPPSVMAFVEKTRFLRSNPRFRLPIHSLVVLVSFATALPSAIAAFPQESKIATASLEADVRQNTSEEFLYFNKGL